MKENAKKLYDHYMSIGKKEWAAELLKKHPEFEQKSVKKAEPKKDGTKPAG